MNVAKSLLIKRCIDITVALLGLVLLSPLLACLAVAIYISLGWPTLFCQQRPGLKGRPFTIYKFRTMREAKAEELWFRSDKSRLSTVGRFVRKLSLDELPSLWNMLKGDMSLVGPRPLLAEYLTRYAPNQIKRHDVPPGITGWAQVNGRQKLLFSQRLNLDLDYVDHWSNWLDLKIIGMTIIQMFKPSGVIPGQDVDEVDDLSLSPDRESRSISDLEDP
jgi:lipopolysaccharide/colanic/teichoic acid biosynthesis glycosyltransferase